MKVKKILKIIKTFENKITILLVQGATERRHKKMAENLKTSETLPSRDQQMNRRGRR